MIRRAHDDLPVVLGRFRDAADAERAVAALRDAGIPAASIDGPTPRTSALAVKVPGRSDRYFIAETLRELGATVQVVPPVRPV